MSRQEPTIELSRTGIGAFVPLLRGHSKCPAVLGGSPSSPMTPKLSLRCRSSGSEQRKRAADVNRRPLPKIGSGGRTRTCDLRVMSPTSCQLLHPAQLRNQRAETKQSGPERQVDSWDLRRCKPLIISISPTGYRSQQRSPAELLHRRSFALSGPGSLSHRYCDHLRARFHPPDHPPGMAHR